MNLTGTEVRVGMTAAANVSSVNTTGSVTIGTPVAALVYTDAPTVAYSLRMDIASGKTLTLAMGTGAVTGSDPGVLQVETATVIAAAGITTAGDAMVIVTASNLTGSPLTVSVPLLLAFDAEESADAIRNALSAIPAITSIFTVSGTTDVVRLTAIKAIANDTTLNISIANGTCAGITAAPTSTNTTAGVLRTQAYRISGATWDETDFEGEPLPEMPKAHCVYIRRIEGGEGLLTVTTNEDEVFAIRKFGAVLVFASNGDLVLDESFVSFLSSDGDSSFTIDIHAGT